MNEIKKHAFLERKMKKNTTPTSPRTPTSPSPTPTTVTSSKNILDIKAILKKPEQKKVMR